MTIRPGARGSMRLGLVFEIGTRATGARGRLAAAVGCGVLSDIDCGDGKRLIRSGGGQLLTAA